MGVLLSLLVSQESLKLIIIGPVRQRFRVHCSLLMPPNKDNHKQISWLNSSFAIGLNLIINYKAPYSSTTEAIFVLITLAITIHGFITALSFHLIFLPRKTKTPTQKKPGPRARHVRKIIFNGTPPATHGIFQPLNVLISTKGTRFRA